MSSPAARISNIDDSLLVAGAEHVCARVQRIVAISGLLVGGSNLAIWLLGLGHFLSPAGGWTVMRVNTAAAVIAASLSLLLRPAADRGGRRAWAARLFGGLAAVIGGLTALQDLAGWDLHIDQLLATATFAGDAGNAFTKHPGRMSLNAALSLCFLGLSLVALDGRIRTRRGTLWLGPLFAFLAALPAALGLVGQLLGIGAFSGILHSTNILFHTAAILFALPIGVLAARPGRPPLHRFLSAGADGILLRWLLPGTSALLLLLAWAIAEARTAGWVAAAEGTALMLFGGMVLLFGLLLAASGAVARQEASARQADAAVRAGEARSRAIIDTANDAVVLLDAAGLVKDWNPAAERIFGWRREEVIGQTAERFLPGLRLSTGPGMFGSASVPGERVELTARRRDGNEFPIELSLNALPGPEHPLVVGFIRDITESKAAEANLRAAKEEAEKANRAKDNFLAALSHELRTPLTPVLLSLAELRRDPRLPDEARADLTMMERNISLEARLIDDLLDLTRISRGKLALRAERCDAHSVLAYAVEIVREEALAKRVGLDLELAARHSGLTGDPARLQQLFWNLLKNAVKFTPAGGHIGVKTHDSEDRLVLEVSDTGVGFAAGEGERLFEPFEQAGREGDHRFGGLGLGLSIARAIVELHGGSIRAESAGRNRGALFTVELPGATEPPDHFGTGGVSPPSPDKLVAPLRLLIIEDHEPTLAVLTRLLTRSGHQVLTSNTVAGALALAEVNQFDAVISDLGLPDGTGIELMQKLRAHHPEIRGVALSGYGMDDDLLRSHDAGFATHLVKPVDFEQLQRALHKLTART